MLEGGRVASSLSPTPTAAHCLQPCRILGLLSGGWRERNHLAKVSSFQSTTWERERSQDKCSGPYSSPGGRSQEIHAFSQSHRIEWATVNIPPSSSLEQFPTTLRGSKISARIWNYQTVTRKNSCYFKHRESKLKSKEDEELRNYGRYNPRGRVKLGTLL